MTSFSQIRKRFHTFRGLSGSNICRFVLGACMTSPIKKIVFITFVIFIVNSEKLDKYLIVYGKKA